MDHMVVLVNVLHITATTPTVNSLMKICSAGIHHQVMTIIPMSTMLIMKLTFTMIFVHFPPHRLRFDE